MSYLKSDQERIKELLSETIILLCKNGLHFEAEFSIEALIAITLDQKNIFLVSIKETVSNERTVEDVRQEPSKSLPTESPAPVAHPSADATGSESTTLQPTAKKRRHSDERHLAHRTPARTNVSYSETGKFHKPEPLLEMETDLSVNKELNKVSEETDNKEGDKNFKSVRSHDLAPEDDSSQFENIQLRLASFVGIREIQDEGAVSTDIKEELMSDNSEIFGSPYVTASPSRNRCFEQYSGISSIDDDTLATAAQNRHSSFSSSWTSHRRSCSELDVLSKFNLQRSGWDPTLPAILGTIPADMSCNLQLHPRLSPDELLTANLILSIPGAFINLGCVKAIRQKLRKVPKETLVFVLETMSVFRDSPFFVGVLRCEGISRTFYKCPPSAIKQEALDYYHLDYQSYADLYNGPIKVPNNIKDPLDWILKTKMISPFLEQQL